jgi:hypothetical protein
VFLVTIDAHHLTNTVLDGATHIVGNVVGDLGRSCLDV